MNLDNPTVVQTPSTTSPASIAGDVFPPTMTAEPGTVTTETAQQSTQEPVTPKKIVVGDKVFNTTEEALAYAEGFVQSQSKVVQQMTPLQEEPVQTAVGKKLGQLIFEDPDQAFNQHSEQIKEEIRAEQRVVAEQKKFWDDFYSEHPDLKGSGLLVDAVLARGQNAKEFIGMNLSQLSPVLAAKARQEVSKIRNVPSGGEALPSTPAMVAGTSGASTPRPQAAQPSPTNFVSELRGMRKKG